jgi:hypothetical protein
MHGGVDGWVGAASELSVYLLRYLQGVVGRGWTLLGTVVQQVRHCSVVKEQLISPSPHADFVPSRH